MLTERRCSRRVFLGLGAGVALACVATPVYMSRIEPGWLRLRQPRVRLRRCPGAGPLRLLHLSDFHLSDVVPLDLIRRAIRMGLEAAPDLVCITGDFITTSLPQREEYAAVLQELTRRVPTYACLGNHDGGRWAGHHGALLELAEMRAFLTAAGIHCLFNEASTARVAGHDWVLVGLGDLWAGDADPAQAFHGLERDDLPCVVLCHNPDAKELLEPYGWDLLLCGHTHGGQLRLPLLGTPFASVRDPRYVAGLHEWSRRLLYVSTGVGNLHGLRFNCPPEVALLTIG
jgi:predicted MPP superfamily phosphohydrolase